MRWRVGGSPVFRVYEIDPDTYEVMDFVPYYSLSRLLPISRSELIRGECSEQE